MAEIDLLDYWLIHRYFDGEIGKYYDTKDFKFNKDDLTLSVRNRQINLNGIVKNLQDLYTVIIDEEYWQHYYPVFRQIHSHLKNIKKDTLIFAFHIKNEVIMLFTKPINDAHWNGIETFFLKTFPSIDKEKLRNFKYIEKSQFGILNFKRFKRELFLEPFRVFSVKKDILKL